MDRFSDSLIEQRVKLMAFLLHLVGDPNAAEDIFQELTVEVLKNPSMLESKGDVFAYLRGVARHLVARNFQEAASRNRVLRRWTEWAWEADPGDETTEMERQEQLEILRRCRGELAKRARKLISLRYDFGLELKVIAQEIGAKVGAVKKALFVARRALGDCIRRRLAGEAACE